MALAHVGIEKQLVKTQDTEVAVVDLTLQIGVAEVTVNLIHVGIEKQLVKTPDTEVTVVDLTLQIEVVVVLLLLVTSLRGPPWA